MKANIPKSYTQALKDGRVEKAIMNDTGEARKQTIRQACLVRALYEAGMSPTGWTLSEVEELGLTIPPVPWDKLKGLEKRSLLDGLKKLPVAVVPEEKPVTNYVVSKNYKYSYPMKKRF